MKLDFESTITRDLERALEREWIETNGLGGWAASTLAGAHTRRYHGLLMAALEPPLKRVLLLSKLDETILLDGDRIELGCNIYPGAIHPRGFQFLEQFERGVFPRFTFRVGEILLRKTVAAPRGENTTIILYEVLSAPGPFVFQLQPLVAGRPLHNLMQANPAINRSTDFSGGALRLQPYSGLPEFFIQVPGSTFQTEPDWYHSFQYLREQERGLDFSEDLLSYGRFECVLEKGSRLGILVALSDPSGREACRLLEREEQRRRSILGRVPPLHEMAEPLLLAADQFLVSRGPEGGSVIAGYPWFSDWGRDAMIALPGLCLVTGRLEDARRILQAFSESFSQGVLPNLFPDSEGPPLYNSVDATLWFFVAVYHYLCYGGDSGFVMSRLKPLLLHCLEWYSLGTHYNIHQDRDGLLWAGTPEVQLTWMDARVGDRPVTPRTGKPVEVNALWYNAHKIYGHLCDSCGDLQGVAEFEQRARRIRERFREAFWNEERGCLYDCLDGDRADDSIRPNQVLALSLPFPLLEESRALRVLEAVEAHLLTPRGLRSLAPSDPGYRGRYAGGPQERDAAYHQGTVWSWLLGPYVTALVRYRGQAGLFQASHLLEGMREHMAEAGIGTISEIFDGDPPHRPRGAIAQAWSVAELLRVLFEEFSGS